MTNTFIEKAREGRRAALASLSTRNVGAENVVSMFEGVIQRRTAVPLFHTTRASAAPRRAALPALVLHDPVAA